LVLIEERVGPGQGGLGLRTLIRRDAARKEPGVDAEAHRKPLDRLRGRARLATLDLRDVLLREAIAREIGLRQAGRHAQLAQPFADPLPAQSAALDGAGIRGPSCGASTHGYRSIEVT